MSAKIKQYGVVYLLTNPVIPGLVKIGMTKQQEAAMSVQKNRTPVANTNLRVEERPTPISLLWPLLLRLYSS